MQISSCLNISFLFPSSNSGGGVNEKRKGPEIRSEREKRVRRKPVGCVLELMPDLPFNNHPSFLKEVLLSTFLIDRLSLFPSLSALSGPVFTFRTILITVIISSLLLATGPSPKHFPQPIANLWNWSRASLLPPVLTITLPSSPSLSANMVPEALLQNPSTMVGNVQRHSWCCGQRPRPHTQTQSWPYRNGLIQINLERLDLRVALNDVKTDGKCRKCSRYLSLFLLKLRG